MKIISIVLILLSLDYLVSPDARRAVYVLTTVTIIWMIVVFALFFPGLAWVPQLYINGLRYW